MRLSEAIRAGAKLSPQAFGDYIKLLPDAGFGTCAIGAAYHALTHHLPVTADDPRCPVEETVRVLCAVQDSPHIPDPTGDGEGASVFVAVINLNDDARWTREAIADYLETQGL